MSQEEYKNLYRNEWEAIEDEKTQPRYLRKVISTPFKDFRENVLGQDPQFVDELVKSLYSGDAYILKQAFTPKFMRDTTAQLHELGRKTPSSFHKMLDGCPDFHRIITPELANNYALRQIKHAYYFFPWNDDPFNLIEPIGERWSIFKFLGGYPLDAYENNIPSTGVVNRVQISQYASGVGELEIHSDPYLNQKVAISGIMSKRGEDYKTGGAYILNKNREKIDIEDRLEVGDVYIVYPTVFHGVETIDKGEKTDWDSFKGRWFMGLYSNESDLYAKRHTCYGVEDKINAGLKEISHPH